MSKPDQILIHHGRTTDKGLMNQLMDSHPLSFRKAQDLVVAVKKFINRSGFFSNDEKRFLKVQTEFSGLLHALAMEGFDEGDEIASFTSFMNIFSVAFPNWPREYEALNEIYLSGD